MNTEDKQNLYARYACTVVLAILTLFFITIIIRTFTRQILIKQLKIKNEFTDLVLFDVKNMNNMDNENKASGQIDWEALYPFKAGQEDKKVDTANTKKVVVVDRYKEIIQSIKKKFTSSTTNYLIGYQKFIELANKYEDIIQWDYASYAEYNGTIKLKDGHLTSYIERREVGDAADGMILFADYCNRNGIDFIYVQAPYKISKTQDKKISGVLDFSNQNADALIERLRLANVDVYDLRDTIDAEKLNHHSLFYRTDHHWLAETGFWASRHIIEYLNQKYGYSIDSSVLSDNQFKNVLYPAWFLGSQGKKVTLAVTKPDDFSLIYPLYNTQMHFSVPDAKIDLDGDFSIIYDMRHVERINYYEKNPYGAYMYGNHALSQFENHLSENKIHLLFIHDSFGNSVVPFISLGVKHVDSMDLRHFTGSVISFVEKNKPDAIIVMYNPQEINKESFDFR